MSVLVCPVCQGAMREINQQGVLIDTCTQCRGVWLDRGELEKLSTLVGDGHSGSDMRQGTFLPAAGPQLRRDDDRRYQVRRFDDDDHDDDKYRHRKPKSKVSRFLDFFD